MLDRHPIARWAVVTTLVASFAGGTYFVVDARDRSLDLIRKLGDVRKEQEAIRLELAAQTILLTSLESHQVNTAQASSQSFQVRSGEHRWLASEINRVIGSMAMEIGRLQQHRHEENIDDRRPQTTDD